MDISYCGDKTGFPRPGHICSCSCVFTPLCVFVSVQDF